MSSSFTFALNLNKDAPFEKLVSLLKENTSNNIVVSTNIKEHDLDEAFEDSIYITHYDLDIYENILLYSLIFKILKKYGSTEMSLKDKRSYYYIREAKDCYNFLIASSFYDENTHDEFLYHTETKKLLSDDEWDELEIKMEDDETVMDSYTYCDYIPVIDSYKYEEPKPKFITYFWKKRKETYEKEAKRALDKANILYSKI